MTWSPGPAEYDVIQWTPDNTAEVMARNTDINFLVLGVPEWEVDFQGQIQNMRRVPFTTAPVYYYDYLCYDRVTGDITIVEPDVFAAYWRVNP